MTPGKRRMVRIVVVALVVFVSALPAEARPKDCGAAPTGLTPLTDLGTDTYQGAQGGLYPDGSNEVPQPHQQLGLQLAEEVVPRGSDGSPDPAGKIVLISIGVSNTVAEFDAFTEVASAAPGTNPDLVMVNGAGTSRALEFWASEESDGVWNRIDGMLRQQGLTPAQVQAAWIMLPSATRGPRTLNDARHEMESFTRVLQVAKTRYPLLQLVYLSSRIYGGYIADTKSEPNAYHHGFEMKWLIEEQINGTPDLDADPIDGLTVTPWIAWGPYLWADGTNARQDGLMWECDDFADDGVHPGPAGLDKVAGMLLEHFQTDPTAKRWFLGSSTGEAAQGTTVTTIASAETTTPATNSTSQDSSSPETDDPRSADLATSGDRWIGLAIALGAVVSVAAIAVFVLRRN